MPLSHIRKSGTLPIDLTEGKWQSILLRHSLMSAIADLLNIFLVYTILKSINPQRAFSFSLIYLLLPSALIFNPLRFDNYAVSFALLVYWFHLQQRPLKASLFWAIGGLWQFFPLVLILAQEFKAFVWQKKNDQWRKSLAIALTVLLIPNLIYIAWGILKQGNWNNWWFIFASLGEQNIAWDTLPGLLLLWFGFPALDLFSQNISMSLVAIALLVKPSLDIGSRLILVCIASLLFNRAYPAYSHLWFYPFMLIALAQTSGRNGKIWLSLFLGLDLLNVLVFPLGYDLAISELKEFQPLAAIQSASWSTYLYTLLAIGRSTLLVIWGILIFKQKTSEVEADEPIHQHELF